MAVSFVVLYNCLVRGLVISPSAPYYLPQEDKVTTDYDLSRLDISAASLSLQLYSCLYGGAGQIPVEESNPSNNINADRRISYGPVDDISQNGVEYDNEYQNHYQDPSNSADASLFAGYPPATTPKSPQRHLPALHTNKRNCHVIKCPRFVHATYGTDGSKCYEFSNACFLAVASCKRHNNRLPRLKEISKKQCDAAYRYNY